MRHYEKELPAGYKEIFSVDATEKKLAITLNLIGGIIMVALGVAAYLMIRPKDFLENYSISSALILFASLMLYLVLHELVHGAAYKLLTKQKLTFGFTLSVAYCGVPDIYVYRKASMIALLAPFCVFTVLFGVLIAVLPGPWDKFCAAILLSVHVGGCVGDLYDTWLYLTRFTDPRTLMRDTGPKQSFYVPSSVNK